MSAAKEIDAGAVQDFIAGLQAEVAAKDVVIRELAAVLFDGERIRVALQLRPQAFGVLMLLVKGAPKVVNQMTLRENVAGSRARTTDSNLVNVTISRLRNQLGPRGLAIITVHGIGYRIDEQGLEAWSRIRREALK